MSISAYLVSWREFVVQLQAHPTQPDFLYRAVDANEPWVQWVPLWTDSPTTAMYASNVYEELRRRLDSAVRAKLDELFGVFFWWNEEGRRFTPTYYREIRNVPDGGAFAINMRPTTVKKYLALWDATAFGRLREPFKEVFPAGVERIEDFDEFKRYVEMWVRLLRRAIDSDRGLIVSVFGT